MYLFLMCADWHYYMFYVSNVDHISLKSSIILCYNIIRLTYLLTYLSGTVTDIQTKFDTLMQYVIIHHLETKFNVNKCHPTPQIYYGLFCHHMMTLLLLYQSLHLHYNHSTAFWVLSGTTRVSQYQKSKTKTNLDFQQQQPRVSMHEKTANTTNNKLKTKILRQF